MKKKVRAFVEIEIHRDGKQCGLLCPFRSYSMKYGKMRAMCLLFKQGVATKRSPKCKKAEKYYCLT